VQAYINLSTAGGDIAVADSQMRIMILQTIIYFGLSCACIFAENWVIRHKEEIREKRDSLARKAGIDKAEDLKIIAGK
jgi:hypothetical protein